MPVTVPESPYPLFLFKIFFYIFIMNWKQHSKEYYKNLIRENELSTKKQNTWLKNILSRILGD
jgi:hypothetical protein